MLIGYAGSPDLLDKVRDMVNIIQKSEASVEASGLLALILERVLLSNDSPAAAMEWLVATTEGSRLTPSMTKILSFVMNDNLISQWAAYTTAFGKVPLTAEDQYQKMRVQGKLIGAVMEMGDIEKAISDVAFEEKDKVFIESAKSLIAETTGDCKLIDVVSSFGTSCALPGTF